MMAARTNTRRGRDVANLLADFDHPLPLRAPHAAKAAADRLFTQVISRRGRMAKAAGWAASTAPLSVWRMTSEQTPVFWPLIAANGLPPTGAQMGIDLLSGGAFYCDPFGWVTTTPSRSPTPTCSCSANPAAASPAR
jgi:hypothetical protein